MSQHPSNARAVLFGDGDADEQASLRDALRRERVFDTVHAALGVLGALAHDSVESEIVRELDELLGTRLGDVILGGLRRSVGLLGAARETAADPALSRTVNLGARVIDTTDSWVIDVRCESIMVPVRCVLAVTVTLDVHATVHGGCLVAVADTDAHVAVSLSSLERPIAAGERTVRVCDQIDLRAPIALLPASAGSVPG